MLVTRINAKHWPGQCIEAVVNALYELVISAVNLLHLTLKRWHVLAPIAEQQLGLSALDTPG